MASIRYAHRQWHRNVPMDECWHCQRERAKCASKKAFDDQASAIRAADLVNAERGWDFTDRLVRHYGCPWCRKFHLRTAKKARDLKKVRRRHRLWIANEETP